MITVRPTKMSDVDALCELQKSAFAPIYEQYHDAGNPSLRGPEDISRRLESPYCRYFTILDDLEIAGGIFYKCKGSTPFVAELNTGEYYLCRIYIKPELQGQGIGNMAILLCEKEFRDAVKFYVDFPKELEKNRRCYTKSGFRDTGNELETEPGLVLVSYEKSLAL